MQQLATTASYLLCLAWLAEECSACNTDNDCNLNGKCVSNAKPSSWQLHENENNVWGRIRCGSNDTGDASIKFMGNFDDTATCWSAVNRSSDPCTSFTYHSSEHGGGCARGCYCNTDGVWNPTAENYVVSGKAPERGQCECYAGWMGSDCGKLDFLPLPEKLSPAYGSLPAQDGSGVASWGASIVRDPDNSSLWHMFVAEMGAAAPEKRCGLNAWMRNSVIVHATAASPMGPFQRQEQLLGYFAHEPVLVQLPNSEGYVIYKIGCADGAVTGSNGTGLVGACTNCSNGITYGNCPGADQSYERACQDVLHSKSLNGPWERRNLTLGNWDWIRLNLGLESQAPIVFPNGTVLTFTRSWAPPAPLPSSPVWLVRADQWNSTYELVPSQWAPAPSFDKGMEDSFMWRDPRGNFHALFHAWDGVGGHAYSQDGLHWDFSATRAYTTVADIKDGTTVDYGRRERPRLIFDDIGNPTHLVNGACGMQQGPSQKFGVCKGDWSFTLVQPIRQGKDTAAASTVWV